MLVAAPVVEGIRLERRPSPLERTPESEPPSWDQLGHGLWRSAVPTFVQQPKWAAPGEVESGQANWRLTLETNPRGLFTQLEKIS